MSHARICQDDGLTGAKTRRVRGAVLKLHPQTPRPGFLAKLFRPLIIWAVKLAVKEG